MQATRKEIAVLGGIAILAITIILLTRDWRIAALIAIAGVYIVAFFRTQIFVEKPAVPLPPASAIAEPAQLDDLKRLNAQLDHSAKLLIRRDLELSRANDKLQQLDRMKSEFVALVTHQLRTPLSGIKWSLSMILNGEMGDMTPEQKTYLLKTYESNERMIDLINDLLQADRLESGMMKFSFQPTQLLDLMDNILIEVSPLAEHKKVRLVYGSREQVPTLSIDPQNMRVVIQNLIENAIKYTPAGGTVTIDVINKGHCVEVTVKDTGIGIPKRDQKNIFQRFYRAPNAVLTETVGSGLGLYIVKNIIDHHHGTIGFTSEQGKGTMFTIILPASGSL
jgi:signal transduction histidine kinase